MGMSASTTFPERPTWMGFIIGNVGHESLSPHVDEVDQLARSMRLRAREEAGKRHQECDGGLRKLRGNIQQPVRSICKAVHIIWRAVDVPDTVQWDNQSYWTLMTTMSHSHEATGLYVIYGIVRPWVVPIRNDLLWIDEAMSWFATQSRVSSPHEIVRHPHRIGFQSLCI